MRCGQVRFSKLLRLLTLFFVLAANSGGLWAAELVVAQVAPFAGNLAGAGRDFNLGAMIGFDDINARGGVNGNTIRFVSRDDGNKPQETVRLVESLIKSEEPIAFIGLIGSDGAEALIKKGDLAQAGVPVLGVRSGAKSLRNEHMFFHLRPSDREEAEKVADQLITMGIQSIGVFYEDEIGLEGLAGVDDELKAKKLKMVVAASYKKGSLDVSAAVGAIGKAKPAAVIMLSSTVASVAFVKEYRAAGHTSQLMIASRTDAEQFQEQVGAEMARGISVAQVAPSPYRRQLAVAADFERLTKKIGLSRARVNFASLEGYLAARVLIEGLKQSGKTPTRAALLRALESMKNADVGGFAVNFSTPQHTGSQYVELSVFGSGGRILQ